MRQKRPLQIGDVITVQLPSHSPTGVSKLAFALLSSLDFPIY